MSPLAQGTIVWAMMKDPRGLNPKCRPGVVLNRSHSSGSPIIAAAVTTTFVEPLAGHVVELPCDSTTLLKRRSVVVCNWLAVLDERDIISIGGSVPDDILLEIIRRLPR